MNSGTGKAPLPTDSVITVKALRHYLRDKFNFTQELSLTWYSTAEMHRWQRWAKHEFRRGCTDIPKAIANGHILAHL